MEQTDQTTSISYYEYNLYWNAVQAPAITNMFQLGQTQLKCRFNPQYHEPTNNAAATINEDTNVPDPATVPVDIASSLELEIGKLTFDGNSFDESALGAYQMSSTNLG